VRRLCIGLLCLAAACTTTGDDGRAKETPSEPATSTTVTVAKSTTEQACDSFEQYWVESAQIYSGLHAFGDDSQDPHLQPAEDALALALSLAKTASPQMQELAGQAELLYRGGAPADFFATVKGALAVCGRTPPRTVCSPDTICEMAHMDEY